MFAVPLASLHRLSDRASASAGSDLGVVAAALQALIGRVAALEPAHDREPGAAAAA